MPRAGSVAVSSGRGVPDTSRTSGGLPRHGQDRRLARRSGDHGQDPRLEPERRRRPRTTRCRGRAAGYWRPCTTGSSRPIPRSTTARRGRWRVTTSAYLYEFRTPNNAKLWAMHWHPAGKSHATFPHLHLYTVRPDGHFPTPRQTLESAVHWCIEMGAEPQNAQWRTVLRLSPG